VLWESSDTVSAHQSCIEMIRFDDEMSRADEEEKKVASYNECVDSPVTTLPFDKHNHGQDKKNAVYSCVSMHVKSPVNVVRDSQDVPYASASQAKPIRAAMSLESAIVGMVYNQRQMVLEELGSTVTIHWHRA
jgi:hypothetical protein